jgi:hypothetical protein
MRAEGEQLPSHFFEVQEGHAENQSLEAKVWSLKIVKRGQARSKLLQSLTAGV